MKKWIVALLCLTSSYAGAVIRPQPGQFALNVEYLYWHPLFDQSYFVFRDTPPVAINTPNGSRLSNPGSWHSGFRIEGMYEMCDCCNELSLRWTRLHAKSRQKYTDSSNNLIPTQGHPGLTSSFNNFAQSDIRADLDVGEALFWTLPLKSPADVRIRGGVNYTYVSFQEELNYTGSLSGPRFNEMSRRASFWGVGPEIALDFNYPLSCILPFCKRIPICIHGDARGSLLVSRSKASFFERNIQATTVVPFDAVNDPIYRLVPVWDLRFGFSSQYACNCFNVSLEVGYEFLSYHNAIQTTVYPFGLTGNTANATVSFDDYANLDYHGPYVSLGFSF